MRRKIDRHHGHTAAIRIEDHTNSVPACLSLAFLLHGYVGFIFGSVKANPWWSSPLMPVVFLFSAMVSGIAIVLLLYMLMCRIHQEPIDMCCVDTVAKYLF